LVLAPNANAHRLDQHEHYSLQQGGVRLRLPLQQRAHTEPNAVRADVSLRLEGLARVFN
jgi:hypothetical protein